MTRVHAVCCMQVFQVREKGGHEAANTWDEATDPNPLDGKTTGRKAVALGFRSDAYRAQGISKQGVSCHRGLGI